jgi:hypothetical protein
MLSQQQRLNYFVQTNTLPIALPKQILYITERAQIQSLVIFCILLMFKTFGLYSVIFPSYNFFNSHIEFNILTADLTGQNLVHEVLKISLSSGKCLLFFGLEVSSDFVII